MENSRARKLGVERSCKASSLLDCNRLPNMQSKHFNPFPNPLNYRSADKHPIQIPQRSFQRSFKGFKLPPVPVPPCININEPEDLEMARGFLARKAI